MTPDEVRYYAIQRAKLMKAADESVMEMKGANVETHGEWALLDRTPRGGTKWTPGVFAKLERTILSHKHGGVPLGFMALAIVAREMGRSSDAVFQAMKKSRRDLLRHFKLEPK